MAVTQFEKLISILADGNVRFVLIGGVAGRALGAFRNTDDLDVVYDRAADNVARLVAALRPYQPYLRGAPQGLPFSFDERTVESGLNFTLVLTIGWLDLLGEATGGGTYDALVTDSTILRLFDRDVRCVTIEALIRLKSAAGRPKDFEAIAELECLRIRSKDEPNC